MRIRCHGLPTLAAILMIGLVPAGAPAAGVERDEHHREPIPSISVTGRAEVSRRPDRAVIRLGAVFQDAEAAVAQNEINRIMAEAIERIRELEIPGHRITTVGLSLSPVYSRPRPQQTDFEPRIVAFRASNTVRVEADDLTLVGPVVDAGIRAGANHVEGLHFVLRDDREARQEALRAAARDAQQKVRVIAEALDVRIVGVLEISEPEVQPIRPMMDMPARMRAAPEMAPTPVQPGELTIEASLVVRYRIADGG